MLQRLVEAVELFFFFLFFLNVYKEPNSTKYVIHRQFQESLFCG